MKKLIAVLLTILMLLSLFQGALRRNVVKAGSEVKPVYAGTTQSRVVYAFSGSLMPTLVNIFGNKVAL